MIEYILGEAIKVPVAKQNYPFVINKMETTAFYCSLARLFLLYRGTCFNYFYHFITKENNATWVKKLYNNI